MNHVYEKLLRCYESIQKKFDFTRFRPDVAIVLGSGLGDYAEDIKVVGEVDYHDIEGFPVSTVKKIDAYTKGVSVKECPVTTFDWSNMQKTYTGMETTVDVKAQAVAKLMQYCGASVGMNYGTGSSGASSSDIPQALVDYFGYDQRVKYLRRSHYSTSEWENIIYQKIC